MSELIKISMHYSDDENRLSKVYKDGEIYIVRCKTQTGTYYKATFSNLNDAENYAEDWVNKDE